MNHQGTKTPREPIPESLDAIATQVVDAAFRVHETLGPGLLESVYETCLAHELKRRGLHVAQQVSLPILYEGLRIEGGLRIDMIAEDQVIVELKAVDQMLPVHAAQVLTYLKLSGKRLGLLINFNVPILKSGIKRFAL
jgi:GxxExxY protein